MNGEQKYLYRAVDSTGQTIDFLLTAKRDATGAKRFFRKAMQSPGNPCPRVINVDKNRHINATVAFDILNALSRLVCFSFFSLLLLARRR